MSHAEGEYGERNLVRIAMQEESRSLFGRIRGFA
jgi:hypothetical protein